MILAKINNAWIMPNLMYFYWTVNTTTPVMVKAKERFYLVIPPPIFVKTVQYFLDGLPTVVIPLTNPEICPQIVFA